MKIDMRCRVLLVLASVAGVAVGAQFDSAGGFLDTVANYFFGGSADQSAPQSQVQPQHYHQQPHYSQPTAAEQQQQYQEHSFPAHQLQSYVPGSADADRLFSLGVANLSKTLVEQEAATDSAQYSQLMVYGQSRPPYPPAASTFAFPSAGKHPFYAIIAIASCTVGTNAAMGGTRTLGTYVYAYGQSSFSVNVCVGGVFSCLLCC